MSKAFHPPDTLSKDEIRKIADVRRDVWTSGFYGMGFGGVGALSAHTLLDVGHRRGLYKLPRPMNRNTAVASFLLGAALGSFVMAVTTGKNEVHNLHPIYLVGRKTTSGRDGVGAAAATPGDHHGTIERGDGGNDYFGTQALNSLNSDEERKKRQRNRLYRRATLTKTMEPGHALSDSHGGHWIDDVDKGDGSSNSSSKTF